MRRRSHFAFCSLSSDSLSSILEPDSVRRLHLPPPSPNPPMSPQYVPRRHTQLSPLCPPGANGGRGLEKTQFEAMIQASRARSAIVGVKKPLALRKEIAVKAQKVMQLERRVRFLNKLCEPPSPSAADSPVTPPDSPTIFHFTLPSPGLQSPWEHFEYVHDHPECYKNTKRVEQVDFRLPYYSKKRVTSDYYRRSFPPVNNCISSLPSLDQISQRLNKDPVSCGGRGSSSPERGRSENSRLPSFLRTHSSPPPGETFSPNDQPSRPSRPGVPRLKLHPASPPGHPVIQISMPEHPAFPELTPSPMDKVLVESQITAYLCPPSQSKSLLPHHIKHTQFASEQSGLINEGTTAVVTKRAQATKDMFNKLGRRTCLPNAAACGIKARDDMSLASPSREVEDKQRRRSSAPAGVPAVQRGAHHPILEKPGGF